MEEIDAIVAAELRERPGHNIGRTDVARTLIYEAVRARKAKR